MITALSTYSQSVLTQLFATPTVDEQDTKTASTRQADTPGIIRDVVEISPEAQSLLEAEQAREAALEERISYFEQFRPTREGFSARNLALGIADPSAQPFSQERPFEEVDIVEKAILRLGCFELKNRIDIPYRVVINEAIELTKTFGAEEAHRFVNGTMDKLATSLRAIEVAAKKGG